MSARYYRNTTLLLWAKSGLVLMLLLNLVYAGIAVWTLVFISGAQSGQLSGAALFQQAELIDISTLIYALFLLPVALITAVLFLVWVYRASANARRLQPDPARIRPGWAVGWFFVPFLNLWKPFSAMCQTWNSSADPKGDLKREVPILLYGWWGLAVLSAVLDRVSARMALRAEGDEALGLVAWIDLASTPFGVLAIFFLLKIMNQITRMQNERAPVVDGGAVPDSSPQS